MTADKKESILDSLNDDSVIYATGIISKKTKFEDGSVPLKAIDPQLLELINGLESRITILTGQVNSLKQQLDSKCCYKNGVEIIRTIENEVK